MAALDKQLHASILNIKDVVDLILTESLYPAGYSSRHPVSMYTHTCTHTLSVAISLGHIVLVKRATYSLLCRLEASPCHPIAFILSNLDSILASMQDDHLHPTEMQ